MSSFAIIHHARTVAAAVLLLAPCWAVAQTMTLTVPNRGPAPVLQTAFTTVEFDPSTIGTSIDVGGSGNIAVPASPCVGVACLAAGATTSGDFVQLKRISGTNRVQVILTYSSDFSGTDYCSYIGPGPADPVRQFVFTLNGFAFANAGNGYRLTSFMAPSNQSCDVPYVRVPSVRPEFSNAGGLAKLGRVALNVVLVLDKSGSMGGLVPGSADVRWDRLNSSVEQFVKAWEIAGAPPVLPADPKHPEGHPDDNLGIVFFDSTTADAALDGVNFYKQRGTGATPWWPAVEAALLLKSPGGATTIGSGIARARTKLDEVDAGIGDTAMVVFTDGEQNTQTCVMRQGETIAFSCQPNTPAAAGTPLILSDVPGTTLAHRLPRGPVFTIGLGQTGAGAPAELLEDISQQTAGRGMIVTDGTALETAFLEQLVNALKGSTMSVLARAEGALAQGASSPQLGVLADDSMQRMIFVARLNNGQRPILEIRRPDNTVVQAPLEQTGNGLRIAAVDIPANGPAGEWRVRILRLPGPDSPATTYHLSAYAVESKLSYRITESPNTGTGVPVTVTAEIGWDGAGLSGLPAGAVKLRVERPGENLGNILFDSTQRGDPGNVNGDAQDALRAKLNLLNAQGQLSERIEPDPVGNAITLTDRGNGRYEATFNASSMNVGGQYRFRVDFDWDDPRTGHIRRFENPERQVPVIPTAAGSELTTQTDSSGNVIVTVTPKDQFGNYVGPGYANFLTATSTQGTVVMPATDPTVRGQYVIRVTGVPPGVDPRVKIVYRGQTLCDQPVTQCETGGGGGGSGSKFAFWFGLGYTFPYGALGSVTDSDFAAALGLEYLVNPNLSIEGTLGLHQFSGVSGSTDIDVIQFGVNGKYYFGSQPTFRPFATLGIGGYAFDPGSTEFGYNVGLGFQSELSPNWSIEGRFTYHEAGSSPSAEYGVLMVNARYKF